MIEMERLMWLPHTANRLFFPDISLAIWVSAANVPFPFSLLCTFLDIGYHFIKHFLGFFENIYLMHVEIPIC